MRTMSLLALALLGVSALGVVPVSLTCDSTTPLGECGNNLLWIGVLYLLAVCGCLLAQIASIIGIVRAVKRRQWGWLLGLVVCILAPLPLGIVLSFPLANAYGPNSLQTSLSISVGLLLTPVAVLVYSWRFPRGEAPVPSSRLAT
jgi:hypothetical protein